MHVFRWRGLSRLKERHCVVQIGPKQRKAICIRQKTTVSFLEVPGARARQVPQLQQFSPMEACFLALDAHFLGRIDPCKLHQVLTTCTFPTVQVHDAVLLFLARL